VKLKGEVRSPATDDHIAMRCDAIDPRHPRNDDY
jgi:hypothetical protein